MPLTLLVIMPAFKAIHLPSIVIIEWIKIICKVQIKVENMGFVGHPFELSYISKDILSIIIAPIARRKYQKM